MQEGSAAGTGPGLSIVSGPLGPEICRILDMDLRERLF
jgi:hypothetical protein